MNYVGSFPHLQIDLQMDNRNWLEDPQRIAEVNPVPLLATSLKGLQAIAADYARKGMRPAWRTTHFQYLVVVARLLECSPQMVLSDNTDILVHQCSKRVGLPLLLRHQYYRFIFEISPYAAGSLTVLNIQPASPQQVNAHLIEVVQEEMKSQLHEELTKGEKGTKKVEEERDFRKEVMEIIGKWTQFTLEDLEKEAKCTTAVLVDVLEMLAGEGVIGDMGSYYWVVGKE